MAANARVNLRSRIELFPCDIHKYCAVRSRQTVTQKRGGRNGRHFLKCLDLVSSLKLDPIDTVPGSLDIFLDPAHHTRWPGARAFASVHEIGRCDPLYQRYLCSLVVSHIRPELWVSVAGQVNEPRWKLPRARNRNCRRGENARPGRPGRNLASQPPDRRLGYRQVYSPREVAAALKGEQYVAYLFNLTYAAKDRLFREPFWARRH